VSSFREQYGPWAVIAGASEGLGEAYAHEAARRGLHVVLIARDTVEVEAAAERVRRAHGCEAIGVAVDLGAPDLIERLQPTLAPLELGLMVYNAAHAEVKRFTQLPFEELERTIHVNCRGPVALAHHLVPGMIARRRGGLVFMASLTGDMGAPLIATYAATKAFNLVLAEGLWAELREYGVDVIASRPGAILTPNFERSRPRGNVPIMRPEAVASATLDALGHGPTTVPGLVSKGASTVLRHFMSRAGAVRFMAHKTWRMYGDRA
jgi:short-subunit dehydrogenase